jgi:hypothetical protein
MSALFVDFAPFLRPIVFIGLSVICEAIVLI